MELPYKADFTGKVAVVTGAGGILCSSMSKALASAGAKVALLDINEESKFQLCAQPRVCSLTGGSPVYPRPNQPDISESWDGISNDA